MRSESDNGLEVTSRFSSCVTKSITGSGSMNAVEDISATLVKLPPQQQYKIYQGNIRNKITIDNKRKRKGKFKGRQIKQIKNRILSKERKYNKTRQQMLSERHYTPIFRDSPIWVGRIL